METILRSKEMAEIKLLPVRHHSPACAFHVQKIIESWQPDAILIEGPDTANEWIPVMVHEDTKAPFAVYYSYDDTTGMVSEEKEKYKCYYPFLDYSPELAALRTGARYGMYTAFVDMPYGDILAASTEGKGLLKEAEKSNYNDDYLLSRSTYMRMLCEKTGMRSFDEFWEKYFELEGLYQDSETWFDNLLTHCRLSRENSPEEELREEGCLQREAYMAERILEVVEKRSWENGAIPAEKGVTLAKETGEAKAIESTEKLQLAEGAEELQLEENKAVNKYTQQEIENANILIRDEICEKKARILVVTGGFHTPALTELLQSEEKEISASDMVEHKGMKTTRGVVKEGDKASKTIGRNGSVLLKRSGNPQKRPKVPAKDQGVYIMPYSMEAADALNGYASGMPFPGFYQSVWEKMNDSDNGKNAEKCDTAKNCNSASNQKNAESCNTAENRNIVENQKTAGNRNTADNYNNMECYNTTVLDYIVRSGKAVRSKDGGISTYDEICACNMAQGLAALRGKPQPGAYELQDAVLSSFVKGEYTIATDLPMRKLRKIMTGNQVGELCRNANEPPILQDFREQCKRFGLNITSTTGEEVTLSIFAKKKHRNMSMFFHRVDFLKTSFAKRMKGPNLQSGRDRNLMREIWKYKWNTQVMAALIDASVYGGTIEEAVLGMVKQELKKELPAQESALLLTSVFEMGLEEQLQSVYSRVYELLLKDTDFYSLTAALRTLTMLQELCGLYQSEMELAEVLEVCCRKVIGLLPAMTRVKEEDMTSCMESLKTLYQVTGRRSMKDFEGLRESYLDALQQMQQDVEIQAGVNGCIHGILYGSGLEDTDAIEQCCRGYLSGTHEQLMKTALFFRGLFFAAKDLVFVGEQFLTMLDGFLQQVPEEDFLKLLPELRMAFTYFTPGEVDRIAASAAGLHGRKREDILEKRGVPGSFLAYGRELDAYVMQQVKGLEMEQAL